MNETPLPLAPVVDFSEHDMQHRYRVDSANPAVAEVPTKPDASMLAAGARAGAVSVEVAWKVYQAMVRAAG